MDTRNEIKSYIVREGMTMADLVEKLADQYGWSASSPASYAGILCAIRRPWNWLMRWDMISSGSAEGRYDNYSKYIRLHPGQHP